jgi:hypothetical protein
MKLKPVLGIFLFAVISASSGTSGSRLPFIHDDYPRALAEAKQRKLPIFVECWAPW